MAPGSKASCSSVSIGSSAPKSSNEDSSTQWLRQIGEQGRRTRESLGLTQQQLSDLAGVSQGAISRFETGRGVATPTLVVLKIHLALARLFHSVDPALLTRDARRIAAFDSQLASLTEDIQSRDLPLTCDASVETLVRIYRSVPERRRPKLMALARAIAVAVTAGTREDRG